MEKKNQYFKPLYTSPEAYPLSAQDLSPSKSSIKHLHTRDHASEISSIADTSSHSYGIVSGQSKSTHIFVRSEPVIDKQFRPARALVVCCTDKLPSSWYHPSAYQRTGETASSAAGKACEKRSWRNHPKVYAPAIRHVVKDGSSASLVIDPSQQSDGCSCIYSASIWELNVTVWSTIEVIGAASSSIGAWSKPHIPHISWRISKSANIPAASSRRQRIDSRGTYRA